MSRPTVASLTAERDAWKARALRAEKQVDLLMAPKPVPKHTPRQGVPDVEGQAQARAERSVKMRARDAYMKRVQKDLEGRGYSMAKAALEAGRLADEAFSSETG